VLVYDSLEFFVLFQGLLDLVGEVLFLCVEFSFVMGTLSNCFFGEVEPILNTLLFLFTVLSRFN